MTKNMTSKEHTPKKSKSFTHPTNPKPRHIQRHGYKRGLSKTQKQALSFIAQAVWFVIAWILQHLNRH